MIVRRFKDIVTGVLSGYIRFDRRLSRATMPFSGGRPALVVPLEHHEAVKAAASRAPYDAIRAAFDASLEGMKSFVGTLSGFTALQDIPRDPRDDGTPYWGNAYFTGDDARIACGIVAAYGPARIFEIGSGNSTKFFRWAAGRCGLATRITSIDPHPRAEIERLVDVPVRKSLLDVPLDLFDELEKNDILFFDGSHLAFHGSDVPHFFLRVLPRIRPGVFVHVHDIFLPEEYPPHFAGRFYAEQYVLGAFLLCNDAWEILAPVDYLHRKGVLGEGGASFWMRRR